jgi:hypothetical protein
VNPSTGDAFVTGIYSGGPSGNNFPTTPGAYEPTLVGCCASFFTELNPNGTGLLHSSYLSGNLSASQSSTFTTGIALDSSGSIWLSGATGTDFALIDPLQSQPALTDSTTGFLSRFDPTGATLLFSTYFGGLQEDGTIVGVATDPRNMAHIAGTTGTELFTTPYASFRL